ncbi:MupA/Atu3671 family FMN-dependent luciferase-like monooxygenase [Umezawaea endophytica]|uniref:LLM class flavin-dependent oxidoreductase n=1 Tax=Umezawaea endophytica TaxID=1654476 RepID=A0A9X3AK60_9PSEU|nr:MupA/Atu3671 family FMN-dependent luciferase-like monooxygenase [Umezawaea endophytica]MCS7482430.1 LLM class flavin-dependent oxidoreductase [Umezawaea endophytica]
MDLSLFYFTADAGEQSTPDAYRLLLEGAKFADDNGFDAVWTPERHFHPFGGPYPNPSVTSAAIAAVTTRIGIRAGSVVLPLHDPLRVAEEWAVVDQLSRGRVGLAFASGWHAVDFALAPQAFDNRRRDFVRLLDEVRTLWRGGTVRRVDGRGAEVDLAAYPRPVRPDPPVWITSAGDPATFELAGRLGANVLTHLLNQEVDDLAAKIQRYRTTRGAGGRVTLMLHAFAGPDDASVRDVVRDPMRRYLRRSLDLSARLVGRDLDEDDVDFLVDRAFERYLTRAGLFGGPETCLAFLDRLTGIGVDEVACLIDFGVDTATTLHALPHLAAVRERSSR